MITIEQLPSSAIQRISEMDRSEQITHEYVMRDGKLALEAVQIDVPPWFEAGHPHSVEYHVNEWLPILESGGVFLAVLDDETLAGFAILKYDLTDTMAQLAALFVSRAYRRQGLAQKLVAEVFRLAQQYGAQQIYVSATPTQGTVEFYQAQGFVVTLSPHPDLFALEPEDIHLIKTFSD